MYRKRDVREHHPISLPLSLSLFLSYLLSPSPLVLSSSRSLSPHQAESILLERARDNHTVGGANQASRAASSIRDHRNTGARTDSCHAVAADSAEPGYAGVPAACHYHSRCRPPARYVYVCVCVCVCPACSFVCVRVAGCIRVCLSLYLSLSLFLPISISIHVPALLAQCCFLSLSVAGDGKGTAAPLTAVQKPAEGLLPEPPSRPSLQPTAAVINRTLPNTHRERERE
jgi:hypothetical protein